MMQFIMIGVLVVFIVFFLFSIIRTERAIKDLSLEEQRHYHSFLFKYGGYIVYLVFLIGLFLNGSVAISHFRNGRWLLGIWALFSIFILPKATLGLILIGGRKSGAFLNMPILMWKIFSRTMQRGRSLSLDHHPNAHFQIDRLFRGILIAIFRHPVVRGFIGEIIWLTIALFPIIAFLFLQ